MPSQEEYLDNLLKGLEKEEETEEPKEGNVETAKEPQIDMSDMDDLLKSALEAQQKDISETQQSHDSAGAAIHPEETSSMSEDEIDRLLQQSKEQGNDPEEGKTAETDTNDDLIRMLESADDAGLSDLLDRVSPEEDTSETADQQEPDKRKKKKEKKEKKKKEKAPGKGFLERFRKKSAEEAAPEEAASGETTAEEVTAEDTTSEDVSSEKTPEEILPEDISSEAVGTMSGSTDDVNDIDDIADIREKTPADDSGDSDIMDILKAAGADIVEDTAPAKEKKGFFSKLLDLFTEEDEDEEEENQLQLSEENKQILDDMDKNPKKKGKKEKKPKKEKAPKAKKPKKEKKKKEDKPSVPEKKLSPKKVIPIVVVCISIGVVILLLSSFLTEYMARRNARKAYYEGDYQTCYQDFFGKELNETEQVMYSKSESILTIRMWLKEYEVFVKEGSELEALDSLLQAVHDYPSLLTYATTYNAQDEVASAFQDILNILSQKYQLDQDRAQEIANISNDVEYTQNVMEVLQNLGLGSWDLPQKAEETISSNDGETAAELPDLLPEEKEIQQ